MQNFDCFYLTFLLRLLQIKVQFTFVSADILKNRWCASCPLRKVIKVPGFIYVQINFSSTNNIQRNGSIKSLPCSGLLLPLYELMKLGVLAK